MNQSGELYAGLHHVSLLVSDIEQSCLLYTSDAADDLLQV